MSNDTEVAAASKDAGPHLLISGESLKCCRCDLTYESYEDARRRPCVSFGAW